MFKYSIRVEELCEELGEVEEKKEALADALDDLLYLVQTKGITCYCDQLDGNNQPCTICYAKDVYTENK